MKATLIPDQLTPLTPDQAISGMRAAVLSLKGKEAPPEQIAVLISQSALETGHWKSLHRYNVGNAKAGPNYEGAYCQFRCNEILNGKTIWFDPPHPQTNFRAFISAADGFADHIKLLATVSRYAKAWARAERGEPEAYSRACAAAGYYTANVEQYTSSVVKLFAKYLPIVREHFAAYPNIGQAPPPILEDDPPLSRRVETPEQFSSAAAMAAATESRFLNIEDLRRDAHRQMAIDPEPAELGDEEEPTRPDLPGTMPPKGTV